MESVVVGIEGMSCQGCVRNITGVLQALPGVQKVEVSLEAKQASVVYDPAQIEVSRFHRAIEDAGFDVIQ